MKLILKSILLVLVLVISQTSLAKLIKQNLVIENGKVNLSGQREVNFALTVNGGIPAPTLEFTEGDEAEITVINKTNEEVSIHWHGMLVPNNMDGVSNLTTPPILPGGVYVFKFPIRQSGTYWYHSHTGLQEQRGVFGAIVIHPKLEKYQVDHDMVVMLNDWTDENPEEVLKNLKKDGDFYQHKKDTVRSVFGALGTGHFNTYFESLKTRMGGMDLSDVGYDAFLINGKKDQQLVLAHSGQKVRLRIINAGASSYFYVNLGKQKFTVISADGQSVNPVQTQELLLGMAETYDVIFNVQEQKNYELRATAQDISGTASAWIGAGEKESAPDKAPLGLYEMNHTEHSPHDMSAMEMDDMAGMDISEMEDMVPQLEILSYQNLRAIAPTEFSGSAPRLEMKLELDGDMSRYTWFINEKTISEDKYIDINKGDVIRFVIVNKTMMHHPMHLHGHFFRLLNGQGKFSPLKHTVDVGPYQTQTIEFLADEPGVWMLHCHNLYHMHSGMAKVVRYRSFEIPHEIMPAENHDAHDHDAHAIDSWFNYGVIDAFSNAGQLYLRTSNTRNQVDARISSRYDDNWNGEGEILGRRWLDKYWNIFVGGEAFNFESRGVVGTTYILPLFVESSVFFDSRGKFRLDLAQRLQWTSHLYSDWDVTARDSQGTEWGANLMYGFNWSWALGAKLTNNSGGVGFTGRF